MVPCYVPVIQRSLLLYSHGLSQVEHQSRNSSEDLPEGANESIKLMDESSLTVDELINPNEKKATSFANSVSGAMPATINMDTQQVRHYVDLSR